MPRHASLAERYRSHREEMELVLATGCTPIEARKELRRREQARRDACGRHVVDEISHEDGSIPAHPSADFLDWDCNWMGRN